MKNRSEQNFDGFWHARGPALESDILNFETLFHNFTPISTISQNVRTIRPVVTENTSGQNLGRKKKKWKKKKRIVIRRRNAAKTLGLRTSFGRLNYQECKEYNDVYLKAILEVISR